MDDYSNIYAITSKETFSYFFVKAIEQLKESGTIRFLFPEAILNVKVHKDIREFILDRAGLVSITTYDDMFSGVTTKYVDIECGNGADKSSFIVYAGDKKRTVEIKSVYETENLIFNLLSDDDLSIVKIVKDRGRYSLQNSTWALGIVTGDNKSKLFPECHEGMEKIYKQFQKVLEDAGVKAIEAAGQPFDPNFHNAVMHVEDESLGENIVAEELQKGYMYRDSVVRHSMVKVAN